MVWHHFLLHPCPPTPLQPSPHYTPNQTITSNSSSKTKRQTKTSNLFQFFQVNVLMHVAFINKRSFKDGFWTPSRLFSPWRFNEWIPLVVPTLFSYCIRPHSTPNCTCLWSGLPLSDDQAFMWNLSHCNGGSIVSIHKSRIMFSVPWNFCNTLFPTPI
jgi:hypothetical protein